MEEYKHGGVYIQEEDSNTRKRGTLKGDICGRSDGVYTKRRVQMEETTPKEITHGEEYA